MVTYKHIPEYRAVSSEQFFADIVPEQQPVIIRDFAKHWPLVQAAEESPQHFVSYLNRYYNGTKAIMSVAPPAANKRFYYSDDMTSVAFLTG